MFVGSEGAAKMGVVFSDERLVCSSIDLRARNSPAILVITRSTDTGFFPFEWERIPTNLSDYSTPVLLSSALTSPPSTR